MIQKLLGLIENLNKNSSDTDQDLFIELKSFMNDTNIELNDAQKNAISEADFNLNDFTQLLSHIDRLAKTYNNADISNEEKQQRIVALKTLIINHYNQMKPKSIEQLKNEARISEIASRYNKLKHHVETEYLMLHNKDGKTFIHHLFENNASIEDIIFYISKINLLPKNTIETYLTISYNKLSAMDLIIQKSKTKKYSWLANLTIGEKKVDNMSLSIITADAHTNSINQSVDQSFVRAAYQYIRNSFSQKKKNIFLSLVSINEITAGKINRIEIDRNDKNWQKKITHDLNLFIAELNEKIRILESETSDELMKKIFHFEYSQEVKEGNRLCTLNKLKTILIMLQELKDHVVYKGPSYPIDPDEVQPSGLNLREMVAISYESLRHHSQWNKQNNQDSYFFTLIDGLYAGRRGYNIELNGDDEWKNPASIDYNKCMPGIINTLANHLTEYKLIEIKVINHITVKIQLLHLLPSIFEILAHQEDFELNYKADTINWISRAIITENLLQKISILFFKVTEDENIYNEYDHKHIVIAIINSITLIDFNNRFNAPTKPSEYEIYTNLVNQGNQSCATFVRSSADTYSMSLEFQSNTLTDDELYANLIAIFYNKNYSLYQSLALTTLYTYSDNDRVAKFANDVLSSIKPMILLEFNENSAVALSLLTTSAYGNLKIVKYLVEARANIETRDQYYKTSLHYAAQHGHIEIVKYLLEAEVDIEAKDINGKTALHLSAEYGHIEIVKYLVEKKADIEVRDKYLKTSAYYAAEYGYIEILEYLIKSRINIDGFTTLHFASANCYITIVKYLVEKGDDIDARDKYHKTSAHYAVEHDYTETLELLIKYGADLDAQDINEKTPLHYAAEYGYTDILKLLIKYGADFEAQDVDLFTPLHYAAMNGHTHSIKLLLEKGANIEAHDTYHSTSLNLAITNNHIESVIIFLQYEANIEARDEYDNTSLQLSSLKGYTEIAELLLASKANIIAEDKNNKTSLHYAAEHKHTEIVAILLNHETSKEFLNLQDSNGRTALHYAVINNNEKMVDLLLAQENIDLNLRAGEDNETALELARRFNLDDIIEAISKKENELEPRQNMTWVEKALPQANGSNREL
jgi:ankyrin repeat protein